MIDYALLMNSLEFLCCIIGGSVDRGVVSRLQKGHGTDGHRVSKCSLLTLERKECVFFTV